MLFHLSILEFCRHRIVWDLFCFLLMLFVISCIKYSMRLFAYYYPNFLKMELQKLWGIFIIIGIKLSFKMFFYDFIYIWSCWWYLNKNLFYINWSILLNCLFVVFIKCFLLLSFSQPTLSGQKFPWHALKFLIVWLC